MGFPAEPPPLDGVTHSYVEVNRARWHVATAGDPDAPPLLLLHGWPQHWWMWRRVIGTLAEDFRVYAPDMRGFGWSDAPAGNYSKMGLASDVETLLDVLEIDSCVVAGHDWGGFVSWLLAIRAPERVERLAVMSIIHPWWRLERSITGIASGVYQLPVMTPFANRVLVPVMVRAGHRAIPGWSPDDARLFADQWARPDHAGAGASIYRTFVSREMPALMRGRYDNRRVECPVVYATGEEDPVITPGRTRGAESHVSDLRTVVIDGAGHFLPEDEPERVAELIRDGA
jgi:pimeloyl-ACP methyl ester carboxylesterase